MEAEVEATRKTATLGEPDHGACASLEPAVFSGQSALAITTGPASRGPECPFEFLDPRLSILWSRWAASLRPWRLPSRDDVDMASLGEIKDIVWLYRLEATARDFRCVMAGDTVRAAWQRVDMVGATIADLLGSPIHLVVREHWLHLVDCPAVTHGSVLCSPSYWERAQRQSAERLVLPLWRSDGRPWGLVGATSYVVRGLFSSGIDSPGGPPLKTISVADLFGDVGRQSRG